MAKIPTRKVPKILNRILGEKIAVFGCKNQAFSKPTFRGHFAPYNHKCSSIFFTLVSHCFSERREFCVNKKRLVYFFDTTPLSFLFPVVCLYLFCSCTAILAPSRSHDILYLNIRHIYQKKN